jgi:thiaminase (transcriptional activator TenA)
VSFAADLRAAAAEVWEAQHAHPFVRGIGDGTLPERAFRFYIRQDYVFLIDYGRLLALGAARAPRLEWMRQFSGLAGAVLESEMDLHRGLAARCGVPAEALEQERPAPATAAYCDFLLRTAALGDFGELAAAVAPCMWAYAEIAERLAAARAPEHAGYAEWIATYADPEFAALAGWARELVDGAAAETGAAGRARMRAAFLTSSEHELRFWEAAWLAAAA